MIFLLIFALFSLATPGLMFSLGSNSNQNLDNQQDKIKEMMLHAWTNYKLYAWGKNELSPVSRTYFARGVFGAHNTGSTIIDALDTLFLMNLTSEYEEGRNWIEKEFTLDNVNQYISVFETNIRYVGGFLSLYALTGDELYKDKAKYVADKLLPAFETTTGLPTHNVNFKTGAVNSGSNTLADIGTLSLEFTYLSVITGDSTYKDVVDRITTFLNNKEKSDGLYRTWIDPRTGAWSSTESSFGGCGDSFYEYLLKSWVQSGGTDVQSKEMFIEAVDAVMKFMMKVNSDGLTYLSALVGTTPNNKMEHLTCFAGGLFALAGDSDVNPASTQEYLNLGMELTKTCYTLYKTSVTGLGPESIDLSSSITNYKYRSNPQYILRPETVESYFYLWRITHDPMYRDWAWEAVQALEKHCRTPGGFSGISNVYNTNPRLDDVQQSFFLAETLKYLYLIYSDDDVLPLNEWVFNTEAHPLPILNQ